MVLSQPENSNDLYTMIYSESVLSMNKNDRLVFIIQEVAHEFDFQLIFGFDDKGEALSSTFWETPEKHILIYLLHKWESPTWVEISKPILLKGENLKGDYYLKFRSHCSEGSQHRKFDVTVWKHSKIPTDNE